jgi:tetratricopeptide (TPR) repeat protein
LTLVAGLIRAGQVPEARRVFAEIPPPESQDYDAALYWCLAGEPALVERNWDRAKECLLKALAIDPRDSYAHFNLARAYVGQDQLAEARASFRACLRYGPDEGTADIARTAIAQINEKIGVDTPPDTAPPAAKPQ